MIYNDKTTMRRWDAASSRFEEAISYPTKTTEFEIQAFLFIQLLQMGLDVRGETCVSLGYGQRVIFDLVIFNEDGTPRTLIEVKTYRDRGKRTEAQDHMYKHFGVPVVYVFGMEGAAEFIWKESDKQRDLFEFAFAWEARDKQY